jgi:hypothetical protein
MTSDHAMRKRSSVPKKALWEHDGDNVVAGLPGKDTE